MDRTDFLARIPKLLTEEEMYARRREPRLNFDNRYDWYAGDIVNELPQFYDVVAADLTVSHWSGTHGLADDSITLLRLQYSAGADLDCLRAFYPAVLWAWEEHIRHLDNWHDTDNFHNSFSNRVPAISFADDNYFHVAIPMLCFGLLLGHADLMPRLCTCWDYINDELNYFDKLIETLVSPFVPGRNKPAEEYTRHLPYRKLDKVFKAAQDKRPALMAKYLDEWYHASRREPGYNMHDDLMFTGYWSYEAAAVTWVFDIDDTSYRDMDFYPRDLVDYAKQNFPRAKFRPAEVFALSGEPCPRKGLWSPRADVPLPDALVQQGEAMPMAEWHDSQGQFHRRIIRWQLVRPMD